MSSTPHLPRRRWSEAAYDALAERISTRFDHRPVAALDWDETCIRGDISYALLDDLDSETNEDLWAEYRSLIEEDRLVAYMRLAVLLLEGRTTDEVTAWTHRVARQCVADGTLSWVPEIGDLVHALHRAEWDVWVVTGSPTAVVAALAPEYGIPADRVIGMDAPLDDEGRYLGHLIEPVTWREGKPLLLSRRAGRPPELAMGDSEGDIRLLEAARHAIWIDRGDPELGAAAAAAGWIRQEAWQ